MAIQTIKTNFPHKLLLTNRQVANLRKAFTNHTSTDIKLAKGQLTKMQKCGFLRFLAPLLLKSGLPLVKSVIKPLGMLHLTAAASATDAAINKKILGSGNHTTLKNGWIEKILTPHPLTNFEIESYYQNEPRFNGVYSRDNLNDKIKDGAYVINLDEYSDIETHWIALYANNKTVTYFDSFVVEHFPKQIKGFIDNKNNTRIQAYDSVMCGYFCIGFINYMVMGKSLTDYTNLFSPNNFKKNDNIMLNYFLNKL